MSKFHYSSVLQVGLCAYLCFAVVSIAQEPPKKSDPAKQDQDPPGLAKSKLRPREGKLQIGELPPNLQATDLDGKNKVQLHQLRGKPVVLIFGSCT